MKMNRAKFLLNCKNRTGNKKVQRTQNRTDQVNSRQFEKDTAIRHDVQYVRKFCFKCAIIFLTSSSPSLLKV